MRISGLEFSYFDNSIFSNFNLSFTSGLTVLTGPSGSGKTTLLRLVSRNLRAKHGEFDFDVSKSLLVVQEDSLLPWLSGWNNLLYFLEPLGLNKNDLESHSGFEIISEFVQKKAWQMSYGQRRAIELFRSVVAAPDILCLDEPLNYLDIKKRKQFVDLLKDKLNDIEYIIVTTHEYNDFASYADRCYEFDGYFPISNLKEKKH